ncbi:TetR/AcrR family transcriptional regulator [Microbacterium sp. 2FI]|uniref:TetR/AcrR family transcriptional regulator n=1 Tax=Microbacterium sp. 2FI TaxID=2502193 RepID=UPI001485C058|nr:TetR/AcrR family transcriptional regulator [Microbacterium sp. 2FI]
MARPSVAQERTQQIVEATIRAIGTHGITGASLERIAEEAGMSRGHVRHFVGNRDELLRVSARQFYYEGAQDESILPLGISDIAGTLDYLFGADFSAPGNDNAVVFGFVEAARGDPALAELLTAAYQGTHRAIARMLEVAYPTAEPAAREAVAYGVLGIALHNVFLNDIASTTTDPATPRAAAERLITTLT